MSVSALLLLLMLTLKHFVADIPLQTNWMAFNKGTFLHPGGLIHAGIHGLLSTLVLGMFWLVGAITLSPVWLIVICGAEFMAHYAIDFSKMNIDRIYNASHLVYGSNNQLEGRLITSYYYYWFLVGDQCLHFICYIVMAYAALPQH